LVEVELHKADLHSWEFSLKTPEPFQTYEKLLGEVEQQTSPVAPRQWIEQLPNKDWLRAT
jgi:hypothetical protein